DDKAHRPRGIALRPSLLRSHPRDDRQRGRARGQVQEFAAENFHDVTLQTHSALRRAVTSISIFMRGSDRPAWIIVAAGLTLPRYSFSTGQHGSKSSRLGNMWRTRTMSAIDAPAFDSTDAMLRIYRLHWATP